MALSSVVDIELKVDRPQHVRRVGSIGGTEDTAGRFHADRVLTCRLSSSQEHARVDIDNQSRRKLLSLDQSFDRRH